MFMHLSLFFLSFLSPFWQMHPSSSTCYAPSYIANPPPYVSPDTSRTKHKKSRHRHTPACQLCKNPINNNTQLVRPPLLPVVPFLIHKDRPQHVHVCQCPQIIHLSCLIRHEGSDPRCDVCDMIYRRRRRLALAQTVCLAIHVLSLASVVALVFGLAHLGSALDRLGLGNEAGTKLDGDENWHDQEMQQILEWLRMVHFATGAAGAAMLGLVYLIGVCGVIGLKRTLHMLDDVMHINLKPILHWKTALRPWLQRMVMGVCIGLVGLTLGTYLLFYSWIWACLLHRMCYRILNVHKPLLTSFPKE